VIFNVIIMDENNLRAPFLSGESPSESKSEITKLKKPSGQLFSFKPQPQSSNKVHEQEVTTLEALSKTSSKHKRFGKGIVKKNDEKEDEK
jgi:hypothetical protein